LGEQFGLQKQLGEMVSALGDMQEVDRQLTELLQSMRGPEAISSAIRRSLRPARHGVTSFRDALSILESWQGIYAT
jgi:hypothetical protein